MHNGMTNTILEELEIPRPPYRMARPVASLAVADALPAHRADTMSPEALQREFAAALPEPKPEEKPASPEAIDSSVDDAKQKAEQRIVAVPSPDVKAKNDAKGKIEDVRAEYHAQVSLREGRTPEQASAEFRGEGKALNSIEDEYESTEAALRRAETAKNPQEVERLTKEAKQYSDVIERKAAAEAALSAKPESAPTPAGSGDGAHAGDIITEGKTRARVLEVDAKGRPTRLEVIEEPQPEPVSGEPIQTPSGRLGEFGFGMQLTPEQQAALRAAKPSEKAPTPESPGERQLQEERARKEDIAFKGAVTRAQTEAIKKNEVQEQEGKAARAPRTTYENEYVLSAVEWASRKTGIGAWLDTLIPRLKSVYHRQFAERRAWQQEKAQGSLERAADKRDDFKAKMADSIWPFKKYYAWRARVWEKAVAAREALVDKYDAYRTNRIERHNELQRQVSDRYERELAPYRSIKESLEREQKAVIKTLTTLTEKHREALKILGVAEAKRGGLFGRRGKEAADRIRRDAKEIEERMNRQRGLLDKVSQPLAAANDKIGKYEARQRSVSEVMKFPEMEGLQTHHRTKPSLPGRRPSASHTPESVSEPVARESGEAGDRSAEEWKPEEFSKEWNENGLVRITDPVAFEKFVNDQRVQAKESGPVKLERILQLTEEYLKSIGSSRGFTKDRQFFLRHVRKGANA